MRILMIATLALAGCAERQQEIAYVPPPQTPAEWCAQFPSVFTNPYATQMDKAALLEKARNMGCLGPAQPQTVIVR